MYLLSDVPGGQAALWGLIEAAPIRLLDVDEHDLPRIRDLMATYADCEMDLADAALVRVAEREDLGRIFTVDRTDFTVYRINGQAAFELIP
jgi:predicted nucleic acid-binding protein